MKEPECIRFSILNFLQSIDLSARFHPGRRWLFVGEHNRNWDAQLHELWPHKIQARVTAQPCNWSERNGEKLFSMCNCKRSRRRTPGWYFLHLVCVCVYISCIRVCYREIKWTLANGYGDCVIINACFYCSYWGGHQILAIMWNEEKSRDG